MALHKSLNSDKQDVRYVSPVTEEREGVHYKQQEGDSGVLPTWNIFVAFFTSFWVRLRLHVALELLGDPCLYYGLQHFYSSCRQSWSTPRRFLSEFKDELSAGDYSVEFVSLGPKNYRCEHCAAKLLKSKRLPPHQRKGNPVKLWSDEANRLERGVDFAVENTARNTPGCKTSGAFHCTKISGNFGPNINGAVRPRWKFSGKSGPPPEVVLFDRSVQSDRKLPFHFLACFFFQSRSSSSLHPVVKMEDGSDVNVYECSAGKLQTQDLNFLLMHGCTQGSGTAVHLNLFFLLVFISF